MAPNGPAKSSGQINESCHTYEWVMSHMLMSLVTHRNGAKWARKVIGTHTPWRSACCGYFHICDMTHTYVWRHSAIYSHVWHDLYICVAWLCYMCDMTHSCVWHDSFMCVTHKPWRWACCRYDFTYVTWLIHMCGVTLSYMHMCDMTYTYVCRDSVVCVTWLIHVCDMTHSCVWHDSVMCVTHTLCVAWLCYMSDMTHSYVWHDSFICVTRTPWRSACCGYDFTYVTWLIHMCGVTWLIRMWIMTLFYMWHDVFVNVTWLMHMCDTYTVAISLLRMCFTCVTWLDMCDVTLSCESYVWHDSFICVTWLIHMCYTWTYQSWLIFKFVWTCSYGVATVSWSIKLQVSFAE